MDREKEQLQSIIDRLEDYKDQWQDVSKQYEIAQNEMLASQILGADWESQILSGRIDTLNTFANDYFAIQQAIADAAWASANAQIEAAKEAAKGVNGNTDTSKTVNNITLERKPLSNLSKKIANGGKYESKIYNPYYSGTKNAKPGWHPVSEDEYGDEIVIDNNDNAYVVNGEQLHYFEGGETVIKASETEKILGNMGNLEPLQTGDMWKNLSANMPDLSNTIKVKTPDYSRLGEVVSKSQIIEQHNQFNISLPNITDNTKATKLFEELQRLPLDALQYSTKRKK